MHAAQGDLGGGDQAQVGVGHHVDLPCLRRSGRGDEADALEHFDAGQVRRDDRREAVREKRVHGVLHQGQFEQDRLVLEEVELLPRHAAPASKSARSSDSAQRDMVFGREVEGAARPSANDLVVIAGGADRGVGVGHVGQVSSAAEIVLDSVQLLLDGGDVLAQRFALGNQLLARVRIPGLAGRLRDFVGRC